MQISDTVIELRIPELDEQIEFHRFNIDEFLLQHKELRYQLNISKEVYELLMMIDGKKNVKKLAEAYSKKNQLELTPDFVYRILYGNLAKKGFIKQNEYTVEKRKRAAYLRLSFIFLKKQYSNYIVRYLGFLFNKYVFYTLLLFSSIFISYIIISNFQSIKWGIENEFSLKFIFYFLAFGVLMVFHELGHATACRKFGAQHGDIGFGFYLFMPVLFADVSDIWKLPSSQRIIVNFAGIYFEMILASILLVLYIIFEDISLLIVPCLLMLNTLYNLNPLIKFDGYWVLSDLINEPNLQRTAMASLKSAWLSILGRGQKTFSAKDYFLVFYAIISLSFIFLILVLILLYDSESILYFPRNLFLFLTQAIQAPTEISITELLSFTIPIMFYILIVRQIVFFIRNWKRKRTRRIMNIEG